MRSAPGDSPSVPEVQDAEEGRGSEPPTPLHASIAQATSRHALPEPEAWGSEVVTRTQGEIDHVPFSVVPDEGGRAGDSRATFVVPSCWAQLLVSQPFALIRGAVFELTLVAELADSSEDIPQSLIGTIFYSPRPDKTAEAIARHLALRLQDSNESGRTGEQDGGGAALTTAPGAPQQCADYTALMLARPDEGDGGPSTDCGMPLSIQKLVQALEASSGEVGDRNSRISTYVELAETEYKHGYLINPSWTLCREGCDTNEDLARDEKLDVVRLRCFLLTFGDIPCPIAEDICNRGGRYRRWKVSRCIARCRRRKDPSTLTLKDAIEVEGIGVHFALSALVGTLETHELSVETSILLTIVKFALLYARHPELCIPLALS